MNLPRFLVLFVFTLCLLSTTCLAASAKEQWVRPWQQIAQEPTSKAESINPSSAAEPLFVWQQTAEGWRRHYLDSTEFYYSIFAPEPTLIVVHPLQLTLLIGFASLFAMLWASDEWEWGRMVGSL